MADGNPGPEALSRLLAEQRPRLHRYCARMVGSAIEGEDVLQDALAKAAEAYGAGIERPEAWLFRIAHNTAVDALRRRRRQVPVVPDADLALAADPAAATDARVAVAASLAVFQQLPTLQRSCVILIDVLGHSLHETVETLNVTLASVKAALHRGRMRLRAVANAPEAAPPRLEPVERARLAAYADRFNARDFDALRDLLAEDVRLDLANRTRLDGAKDVAVYFARYAERSDWRLRPGLAEGRPALLVTGREDDAVRYVVLIDWAGEQIGRIRDFIYAPYAMENMDVSGT